MNDDKPLLADGFDSAVLGLSRGPGSADVAVYSIDRCIDILVKRDGMSEEEAIEFMFGAVGAFGCVPGWFLRFCKGGVA
jgi:hypothetical protein